MNTVAEICRDLNKLAGDLAPSLLPNGRLAGNKWMASGINDTGKSESLYVHLDGDKQGKWFDMGNAAHGEDKGDMLDLLRLKGGRGGCGFATVGDALQEAKRILGIEDRWTPDRPRLSPEEIEQRAAEARERAAQQQAKAEQDREAKMRGARSLYLKGQPSIVGTPAEAYLVGRGMAPFVPEGNAQHWPGVLRFHPEVYCKELRTKEPCMLAAIVNAEGKQIGTHRTWLQCVRGHWQKLAVEKPKKVLGTFWGGFIPISKGASGKSMRSIVEGEPVTATEGIEKAIAIGMLRPASRIITTVSLPNMGAIVLPPAAQLLHLVCDRDESETAQGQLERSIAQQQARGLEVKWTMPLPPFKDIDEWMLAFFAQERAGANAGRGGA